MISGIILCAHLQLCNLAKELLPGQSQIQFRTVMPQNTDPHEFDPGPQFIKEMVSAPIFLAMPDNYFPWIQSIIKMRKQSQKTFSPQISNKFLATYKTNNKEALAHFWLYPHIHCEVKKQMANFLNVNSPNCASRNELEQQLLRLKKYYFVLTHDSLAPLLSSQDLTFTQIKTSHHHDQISSSTIKDIYNLKDKPNVIWLKESQIQIPQQLKNSIPKNVTIVEIDTEGKLGDESLAILNELSSKFSRIP